MNKTLQKVVLSLALLFSMGLFAQIKNQQFQVSGNCSMCKERIENASKKAGSKTAQWDAATKVLRLTWDEKYTDAEKILQSIAEAGHDNEKYTAPDDVYAKLPACCLYERPAAHGTGNTSAVDSENKHPDVPAAGTAQQTEEHHHHEQHTPAAEKTIEGVQLQKTQNDLSINRKAASVTYDISSKELLKAACCNLSESFETNPTVDVSYANAATGSKQIIMLGLDQKYTAFSRDLLPEFRGLAQPNGLTYIPGKWVAGLQLTKGGGTATQTAESMTGSINTELLKYKDKNTTALNFYASAQGRMEGNLTHLSSLNDKWSQSILLHANSTQRKMDENGDTFLDQMLGEQMNVAYLTDYNDLQTSGWGSHFGIQLLRDNRQGGQVQFDKDKDPAQQPWYGASIETSRIQLWNKTGYIFKGKPYQSLGLMNQFTAHRQHSSYGLRNYDGRQITWFSNLIFESIIGNTNHRYKTGVSFIYDRFDEDYLVTPLRRTETSPGLFAEYTLTLPQFTLVAGTRADFHNLAGTQLSPRLNAKYDLTDKAMVRLSAGRGFRMPNILAEAQRYFMSGRQLTTLSGSLPPSGTLDAETAWNYGLSFTQNFRLAGRTASLSIDAFRTAFQNQILYDIDQSRDQILVYNNLGKSSANSLQIQTELQPLRQVELRAAYKYYDVRAGYLSGERQLPLQPKHRGFVNTAYTTAKNNSGKQWTFDTTLQVVGPQRLPDSVMSDVAYAGSQNTPAYALLHAQAAYVFGEGRRIYIGGENLTGVVQKTPVLSADNPFGPGFDAGMLYAPTMKANVYLGVDFQF